ncbi:hypothetical protein CNR22_13070 [Sphingobacteriaceae bacterium]|nr:hypothetical protein CNR22_13070 [Sphingobacteriaceae bacterium]
MIQKSALKVISKTKNMTTTLTNKKDASSKMSFFTGLESISFKTVSILVILILNITTLSSQTNGMVCGSRLGIKSGTVPEKPKTITLYSAKNFPVIEISSNHTLHKMDDLDNFDYEKIFCSTSPASKNTGPGSQPAQLTSTYNKNQNNKFAPRLN